MKRIISLIALFAAVILVLCACSDQAAPQAPQLLEPVGVEIDTAVCRYSEIFHANYYDSAVVPYTQELSMALDGSVAELLAYPGQQVKAGDPMLVLNLESVQDQYDDLTETIAYTRQVYAYQNEQSHLNIQMLYLTLDHLNSASVVDQNAVIAQQNAISDAELTLRQAEESQALELSIMEDQLAVLEEQLGQNTLYAPFDGTVVYSAPVTEGSWLAANTPIFYLADDNRILLSGEYIAITRLPENARLFALIRGQRFDITMVEKDYSDTIADIWAGFAPTTEFTIDGPAENMDLIGMGDYAAIMYLTQYEENALVVPTGAVFKDVTGNYVYIVEEDGTRTRTPVTIGTTNESITQIEEGLQEGDVVYVQD